MKNKLESGLEKKRQRKSKVKNQKNTINVKKKKKKFRDTGNLYYTIFYE